MDIEIGDLVACYLTNTEVYEEVLDWGIVMDVNIIQKDILILHRAGHQQWWPRKRWRILQKKSCKNS